MPIDNLNAPIAVNNVPGGNVAIDNPPPRKHAGGRPKGSTNLHSKHPSSIAWRLKQAGIDWIVDLAKALKANNLTRINVWMRLLPYLVVTQGHRRPKRWKGKASKAAVQALAELEGRE
jgi:hypothetical protein